MCFSEALAALQDDQLYISTYSRFGPWVIGVAFGYLMYEAKTKELKLSLVMQYYLSFILFLLLARTLNNTFHTSL
jgi:hypothetical protein